MRTVHDIENRAPLRTVQIDPIAHIIFLDFSHMAYVLHTRITVKKPCEMISLEASGALRSAIAKPSTNNPGEIVVEKFLEKEQSISTHMYQ